MAGIKRSRTVLVSSESSAEDFVQNKKTKIKDENTTVFEEDEILLELEGEEEEEAEEEEEQEDITKEQLMKMNITQLRGECKKYGVKQAGIKAKLVENLYEYHQLQSQLKKLPDEHTTTGASNHKCKHVNKANMKVEKVKKSLLNPAHWSCSSKIIHPSLFLSFHSITQILTLHIPTRLQYDREHMGMFKMRASWMWQSCLWSGCQTLLT